MSDPDWLEAATRGEPSAVRAARAALQQAGDSEALAAVLDPLARAAASGSLEATELVVWAVDELGLARATIRRLVVNDSDAEDVDQDVLIAVAETIRTYRGEARFTTWLHQVARNKAIACLRRRRPDPTLDPTSGDSHRISSMIATRTTLATVIESLDPRYREPLLLRDAEHFSYDRIAQRLGLNLNTVKTRIARGRALVAARVSREWMVQ